jgi:Nuclease-related domain
MNKSDPLNRKNRVRAAGESLKDKGNDLFAKVISQFLVICSLGAFAVGYFTGTSNTWLALIAAAISCVAVYTLVRVYDQEFSNLRKGARGELFIASALGLICPPRGMTVFNDFLCEELGGDTLFNLDHVVVGAQGVFVFETKFREKPNQYKNSTVQFTSGDDHFVIGGYTDKLSIPQTRRQARWLQQSIKKNLNIDLKVYCATVLPGWFIDGYRIPPPGSTALLNDILIPAWIDNHGVALSPAQLQKIKAWIISKNSLTAAATSP